MEEDQVVSGRPGGLSSCGPSPAVSAVPASIPDALPGLSLRETLALFGMRGRDNEGGYYDEGYYSFAAISEGGGLPLRQVRRAVRSLARKGYARYARGLWSEYTDKPAGAGYGFTAKGLALVSTFDDISEIAFWAWTRHRQWQHAQAMETRRAETEGLGAEHDSAVAAGDAPKDQQP